MKPQDIENSQTNHPILNQGSMKRVVDDQSARRAQETAAQIIRSQIDNIFAQNDQNNANSTPEKTSNQPNNQAYTEPQADKWKKYHSAWQQYYQKYYEGYYSHRLKQAEIAQPQSQKAAENEKIDDLKQKLLEKVQDSATKVRKSRHFIPIAASLIVVLLFLLLQYNRLLISNVVAYVSPGSIDPQNIVIDPNADITVSAEPRLIIPKINVDVPVVYDIGSDYNSQMAAMTKGVAHFSIPGASSHPGQIGNTAIAGHSSNDLLDSGDYKFIFAQLEKLTVGDMIYANYQSKRYTYTITKTEVVKPTDLDKLTAPTTKPTLTLITCTPLGTSKLRLLVTAEQVSPDPATASTAASTTATGDTASEKSSIPGNSPTFIERIFGGGR